MRVTVTQVSIVSDICVRLVRFVKSWHTRVSYWYTKVYQMYYVLSHIICRNLQVDKWTQKLGVTLEASLFWYFWIIRVLRDEIEPWLVSTVLLTIFKGIPFRTNETLTKLSYAGRKLFHSNLTLNWKDSENFRKMSLKCWFCYTTTFEKQLETNPNTLVGFQKSKKSLFQGALAFLTFKFSDELQ